MKTKVEPLESFLDDAPVHDWNVEPARDWREPQAPQFNCGEAAKLAVIGLGMVVMALTLLVLAFIYFE